MRLPACLICLLTLVFWGCDEEPPRQYERYYYDMACAVAERDDGGFVMVGISTYQWEPRLTRSLDTSLAPEAFTIYLQCIDAEGKEEWTRFIDGHDLGYDQDLSTLPDVFGIQSLHYGQFMVAGVRQYWEDGEWQRTMFQKKLGTGRNSSWMIDFDIPSLWVVEAVQVIPLSTGGFLLQTYSPVMIEGSILISNVFGEIVATLDYLPEAPIIESPHGVLVQASVCLDRGSFVNRITRRTLTGEVIDIIEPELGDFAVAVLAASTQGGYLLAGGTSEGACAVLVDVAGDMQWMMALPEVPLYAPMNVATVDDGWIITTGSAADNDAESDIVLIGLSDSGETVWSRTINLGGEEVLKSQIVTTDGGLLLCGTTVRTDRSGAQAFLIKTNEYGIIEWEGRYGP